MLKGRLGLESARIPQVDRHGLTWLGRGKLVVEDGTLHFLTAGYEGLEKGDYTLPFQMVSCILLEPGSTVSHDALRLLARHGTGLVAIAQNGVRFYASMPFGPDTSARARRQASEWADPGRRLFIARKMYGWRLGELLTANDLDVLRGIEGARMKKSYQQIAAQFGLEWHGRRYDRSRPETADVANQAINHAASAVEAAALIAVAVTGTIPQLGFIHEDSGNAFALDVADLFRDSVILPIAFGATREFLKDDRDPIERRVRQLAGRTLRKEQVVVRMIDRIKELFDADDGGGDT